MVNKMSPLTGTVKAALFASALLAAPAATAQTVITLPLFGTVDAVIDWGAAGANESCTRAVTSPGEVTCNYPVADGAGPFEVRISGTVTQFGNGDAGYSNPDKIIRVNRFGNIGLTSLSGAFKGAERLIEVAPDFPETVTDVSYMFKDAVALNDDAVSNWGMRTRNVTNMSGTFENAVLFSQSLDGWCAKSRATPPAAFRALTKTQIQIQEIQTRLRGHGGVFSGITLNTNMNLDETKEPRWGQCGLTIDATAPAAAEEGTVYSLDLRARTSLWANAPADADVNSLVFEVASGDLPPGITLNGSSGLISGTPTAAGTYNFAIRAVQN